MTIKRGQDWGEPYELTGNEAIAFADRDIVRHYETYDEPHDAAIAPIIVRGGDLARDLGAQTASADPPIAGTNATIAAVDLGLVVSDGAKHLFVAHVVVRKRLYRGEVLAVMNAAHYDKWDVAPRGHPNDAKFDVVDCTMSWSDKWKARSRLVSGTHVPHPDIKVLKRSEVTLKRTAGQHVWIDGHITKTGDTLSISIIPDAMYVVIEP